MPIYVFPLLLEIRTSPNRYHDNPELSALGFSGIHDFEAQLPKIARLAAHNGFGRFFSYYPEKGLVVATARPHYESEEDKLIFKAIWFHEKKRHITKSEVLENCPSLSKFNACRTCQFVLGSLPCFAKALPTLSGSLQNLEQDFLRYDDLPVRRRYHRGSPQRTRPVAGHPGLIWAPPTHVKNYRYGGCIVRSVRNVNVPDIIERRIEDAKKAAQQGHKTRERVKHCPKCYFYNVCTCRWFVSRCGGPHNEKNILEKAMGFVHEACERRGLSLEELRFFINVGGHVVYPHGFPMVFEGLSEGFHKAVFHTRTGSYHERVDFDVAKTWLRARYWYRGQYTRNVDHVTRYEISDESLAAYWEICKHGRFKTGNGWTPYSGISSVYAIQSGLGVSFYSRNCDRRVHSYGTLFNKLPRLISAIDW